jgi:hypothetical protein
VDDPGAKRTMFPVVRLETNSALFGPAVMLSGKNADPGNNSGLVLDALAAVDPVAIAIPATSNTLRRIRPISSPVSTGLSVAILPSVCWQVEDLHV